MRERGLAWDWTLTTRGMEHCCVLVQLKGFGANSPNIGRTCWHMRHSYIWKDHWTSYDISKLVSIVTGGSIYWQEVVVVSCTTGSCKMFKLSVSPLITARTNQIKEYNTQCNLVWDSWFTITTVVLRLCPRSQVVIDHKSTMHFVRYLLQDMDLGMYITLVVDLGMYLTLVVVMYLVCLTFMLVLCLAAIYLQHCIYCRSWLCWSCWQMETSETTSLSRVQRKLYTSRGGDKKSRSDPK